MHHVCGGRGGKGESVMLACVLCVSSKRNKGRKMGGGGGGEG